jgi:RecA-family ATPase
MNLQFEQLLSDKPIVAQLIDVSKKTEKVIRTPLLFRSISEHFNKPEPLRWLAQGWIESSTFCAMIGEPGSGKTFVALDLACSIATGKEWHNGLGVLAGPVLYIAGEGKKAVIRRALAWNFNHGDELRHADRLYVSETALIINDSDTQTQIRNEIMLMKEKPVLLIVDTLNRSMMGDENDTQAMTGFIQALDRIREEFKCAVLVLHHPSKSAPDEPRGSSSFKGAVDSVILVKSSGNAGNPSITLKNVKQRSDEPASPISFGFSKVEMPNEWRPDKFTGIYTVAALEPVGTPASSSVLKGLKSNQKDILLVLQRLIVEQEKECLQFDRESDESVKVSLKKWRTACIDAEVKGQSFTRAKDSLIARRIIFEDGLFVFMVSARELFSNGMTGNEKELIRT